MRLPKVRGFVGVVVAAALAASALAATGSAQAVGSPPTQAPTAKIRPALLSQFEQSDEVDFWVRMDTRADLGDAFSIADWDERGRAVVADLKATAKESQADVIAKLDATGTKYRQFWATNAVYVENGSQALATSLAGVHGVNQLWPSVKYGPVEPAKATAHAPDSIAWGVSNINADKVWSQLGVDGHGIVVANIDTGVQFDHPALVNQYRGNNGDGTFTHDSNWYDIHKFCKTAGPCDDNGHGTHTMGTMLGGDGGSNQIGVAPGATWIAANGCATCLDVDLVAAGQWMLAPTKTDGTAPDPTQRPNIVNNSWGTKNPSNEPFMEDISQAWSASGIFGVWSNGNAGPECQTSGAPGSLTLNYSVGAYDSSNTVASFSSRGYGQDGTIKPNISAPGSNILSSLPGDHYGVASGTSMAAPHTAGAIALLWSAWPALVGDVERTKELLDQSAIDTEDLQCGGTAADNNVYGEGRLDALALVRLGNPGPTGAVNGTITSASTGKPIANAKVRVQGEHVARTLIADADGSYRAELPIGDYQLTTSAFGFLDKTDTVSITEDTTTTRPIALDLAPVADIAGQVSDASGHGWPLYAKITIPGVPNGVYYTTPATGRYDIALPANATYTLKIEPVYPGYRTVTQDVQLGTADVDRDVDMVVDETTCSALGYGFQFHGANVDFGDGALPDGWTVVDHQGNGQVWRFDDPGHRGNLTGGSGGFAILDSKFYGTSGRQSTSLVSPVMDLSDAATPQIAFNQDYDRDYQETANVELSLDGGTTWTNVAKQTYDIRGPKRTTIDIPQAAGQSDVQVRFRYDRGWYFKWWEIDDVLIGDRTCDASADGGYLVGNVHDANTGAAINGASVTSGDQTVTTMASPRADQLGDGMYWMYLPTSEPQELSVSADKYATNTQQVVAHGVTPVDLALDAGQLTVKPTKLTSTLAIGNGTAKRALRITNSGKAPVQLQLGTDTTKAPWLTIDRKDATLAAGQSITATVTMRGKVSRIGKYAGSIGLTDDTPYAAQSVGTTMTVTKAATSTRAVASMHKVKRGGRLWVMTKVSASGVRPAGLVIVSYHGHQVGKGRLSNGQVTVKIRTKALPVGKRSLKVRFGGSSLTRPSTDQVRVKVRR